MRAVGRLAILVAWGAVIVDAEMVLDAVGASRRWLWLVGPDEMRCYRRLCAVQRALRPQLQQDKQDKVHQLSLEAQRCADINDSRGLSQIVEQLGGRCRAQKKIKVVFNLVTQGKDRHC